MDLWANNERQCHTFTDLHEVRWASPEHDFRPTKVPHCSLNASSSDYKANIWAFKAVSSWLKKHWTLHLYGKLALQLEAFQQSILWSQNSWKKQRPMGMASGPMGIAWLHLASQFTSPKYWIQQHFVLEKVVFGHQFGNCIWNWKSQSPFPIRWKIQDLWVLLKTCSVKAWTFEVTMLETTEAVTTFQPWRFYCSRVSDICCKYEP